MIISALLSYKCPETNWPTSGYIKDLCEVFSPDTSEKCVRIDVRQCMCGKDHVFLCEATDGQFTIYETDPK